MNANHDITPIFIFSLPRCGSTLTQRILASHEAIATTSEPFILLPFLYTLKNQGIYAEYRHLMVRKALEDFFQELPLGADDYIAELRHFSLELYSKASGGKAKYFLDKTPRYHLIVDEIFRVFPNGKFIFLWRNPLAMIASMVGQFWSGRWKLHLSQIDLFDGAINLVNAFNKHQVQTCSIHFEDLVQLPETTWEIVFDYLDLPFDPQDLSSFNKIVLKGRYGDKHGVEKYKLISTEPLIKWKQTLNNPYRKFWCRRYLNWIGTNRLQTMGYDMDSLISELENIPTSYQNLAGDLYDSSAGMFYRFFEPKLFKDKFAFLSDSNYIHTHT